MHKCSCLPGAASKRDVPEWLSRWGHSVIEVNHSLGKYGNQATLTS